MIVEFMHMYGYSTTGVWGGGSAKWSSTFLAEQNKLQITAELIQKTSLHIDVHNYSFCLTC